jgi:hypothetical protein
MTYCTIQEVRREAGLESSDITDEDIRELRDTVATPQVNEDINVSVESERLDRQISQDKQNEVDGENKTFFLRELHRNDLFIGDRNNDGVVDGEDVQVFYISGDDERVEDVDVTVLNRDTGRLRVENPDGTPLQNPEVQELLVNYEHASVDENGFGDDREGSKAGRLVRTACAQLTASYCFTNIDASKLKDFSVGDVSINTQSQGAQIMRNRYQETVQRITQKDVIQSGENRNTTDGVFNRPVNSNGRRY